MDEYFNTTLKKLRSKDFSEMTVVIGNESCDLDSAICTIVYATFLHWQNNIIKCKVCTKTKRDEIKFKDDIFLAVLDVDRRDFPLKTEVAFCLREHGIGEAKLIFRDDINLKELIETTNANVVLVDHHVLPSHYQYMTPYVKEIIDHRPIDKSKWKYKEDTRSTLEMVGSCSTLVAQRIKDLSVLLTSDVDFLTSNVVCSELLHCTIILDTVNFSKEVDKATPHDEEIVLYLEGILKPNDYKAERKCKLERLVEARGDVSRLTSAQLVRKDLKVVGDFLVPSFPILVEEFLKKPEALDAVTQSLMQNNCRMALLLGMCLRGELKRDVAIYSPKDIGRVAQFGKFLQVWSEPPLELAPHPPPPTAADCLYFKQMNLSASRKQHIAVVTDFLHVFKD